MSFFIPKIPSLIGSLLILSSVASSANEFPLPIPAQDQGLAYTRSALEKCLPHLQNTIALHQHSRYVYFHGTRTRLDQQRILKGEPQLIDGILHIPQSFAQLMCAKTKKADEAPEYLSDRYVHQFTISKEVFPPSLQAQDYQGQPYISLTDLASYLQLPLHVLENDLIFLGELPQAILSSPPLTDALESLFDTPDTIADPAIAQKYIPLLKRQGAWTDYVNISDEQLKLYEGEETEWKMAPPESYQFDGFNKAMLGSAVPAPGVYPRILFSPQDLPTLRKRFETDKAMKKSFILLEFLLNKTWLDPKTSDGKTFLRLVEGGPLTKEEMKKKELQQPLVRTAHELRGQKGRVYNSHVSYNGHCLVAIAYYSLITNDSELGQKVAKAICNYSALTETLMDEYNAWSDSEWGIDHNRANGGRTAWRAFATSSGHMDLPWLLDFGGHWMDDAQKAQMARLIAKATYGKAESHHSGPARWIDNNHCTWHTTIGLAAMAIEGLEGHDPECVERVRHVTESFCQFGINEYGTVFESNGKSGAGFQFQTTNMVAFARRGSNYFGHPHFRKLMDSQMMSTSPNGELTFTSGTYSSVKFDPMTTGTYKTFFPDNKAADFILTSHFPNINWDTFDFDAYRQDLEKSYHRKRLPILNNPLSPHGGLYESEWEVTKRSDISNAEVINDTTQGILSAFSKPGADAEWMLMQVRPNHYLGAGHHHADSGIFIFGGHGVNWFTESPITTAYNGEIHNSVLIDGKSMADGPSAATTYLGANTNEYGAVGSADLGYAYSWRWSTQTVLWDKAGWWGSKAPVDYHYEFEPSPSIIDIFKGTQHRKMRPWWPSYTYSNWFPTVRAAYNPVEYVYRSSGLVRGKHAYGIIVDDAKKDDQEREYQWTAALGRGVWTSELWSKDKNLPNNQLILTHESWEKGEAPHHAHRQAAIRGKAQSAQLLVCILNHQEDPEFGTPLIQARVTEGPYDKRRRTQRFFDQVCINTKGKEGQFRVLMIPFYHGEPLPKVTYNSEKETAQVQWKDQTDTIQFKKNKDHRTQFSISRQGKVLLESK